MYPGSVAVQHPDRPAMVLAETGETVSYAELDDRSARLAAALTGLGVPADGTVLLLLDNDVRWGEVAWACWRSGRYLAAANHHLTRAELVPLLEDSTPAVVLSRRGRQDDVRAAAAEAGLGDLLTVALPDADEPGEYEALLARTPRDPDLVETTGGRVLFSSGTTGRPKPFRVHPTGRHPDDEPVRSADLMRALGFGDTGDVLLVPGPAYHAGPLGFLQSVHQLGGTVVLMRKFDAAGALAAIERYRVTHSQWVPTMLVRLLRLTDAERTAHDLSSHRVAVHAAAPCPPDVKRAVMDWWGPILHEYYGASEGVGRTTIGPHEWLEHPGSVGRPAGCTVHVADESGALLPPGQVGQVWFAKPGAPGPDGGRVPVGAPGWGCVGDLGRLDADGFLYLSGRAGQTIITGGVNVYPREVEDVLVLHPAVDDVAVLGAPDDEYGERVVAVVVPAPGVDTAGLADELTAHCRARLARVKCPRVWEFTDRLPRSDAGKVRLPELRARFAPQTSAQGS